MTLEAGLRPPIINYETVNVTARTRMHTQVLLEDAGCCLIPYGGETLAMHQCLLAEP